MLNRLLPCSSPANLSVYACEVSYFDLSGAYFLGDMSHLGSVDYADTFDHRDRCFPRILQNGGAVICKLEALCN